MQYELYVVDTETTGLCLADHSPTEISIYRLATEEQRTWYLRPINLETISIDALRVTGQKIEDLKWQTQYGRQIYQEPSKVLVEIEEWLAQDNVSSTDRLIVGHNAKFDKDMMFELWKKCGTEGTYPFNEKYCLDTMVAEFMIDLAKNEIAQGYGLKNLCKKYGVKNEKAHSSEADTRATVEVFRKQIEVLKKAFAH
jgi:DNA polymerase III epsilon subunit-like protein